MRAGVRTVLLPSSNRKDIKDLPREVKDGLDIVHVRYALIAQRVPDLLKLDPSCLADASITVTSGRLSAMSGPMCIGRMITSSPACTLVCEAKPALDQSLPYASPSQRYRDNASPKTHGRSQTPHHRASHWSFPLDGHVHGPRALLSLWERLTKVKNHVARYARARGDAAAASALTMSAQLGIEWTLV